MNNIVKINKYINNEDAFRKITFLTGFLFCMSVYKLKESPMSTIFWGLIWGFLYSCIATLIFNFAPDFFKPVISWIMVFYTIYLVYDKIKNRDKKAEPFLKLEYSKPGKETKYFYKNTNNSIVMKEKDKNFKFEI